MPVPIADRSRAAAPAALNLDHPALHETKTLFAGLEEFRQHLGGRLTLTMLREVGDPIDVHEVDRTAVRGGTVTATATPLKVGRTMIVVETEVRDSRGRLVVKTTQSRRC